MKEKNQSVGRTEKEMAELNAAQTQVIYRMAIEHVSGLIFDRCTVETKIWFAATPGRVVLNLK